MVTVVLGAQWGDEGKLVDLLCSTAEICARCQGGNNAGHTIVAHVVRAGGLKRLNIQGLVSPKCVNLVGTGVVVHVPSFFEELANIEAEGLDTSGRIFVSDRAHLVFGVHQIADGLKEQELGLGSIGTTKKGIGPAYSSKASRSGIRVHHLLGDWKEFESKFRSLVVSRHKRYGEFDYNVEEELVLYKGYAEKLRPFVVDNVEFLRQAFDQKKAILVEGANALMLDLDFGTYPFVTSSNTGIGGVSTGLGIPPQKIKETIGVVKAYTTRVGAGPFPTELLNSTGEHLQEKGQEWGVTTGRRRRTGWLDLVVVKYSTQINGYTSLNLTKLDILDELEELKIATAYIVNGTKLKSFPADLNLLGNVQVEYKTLPGWKTDLSKITDFECLPIQAKAYIQYIEDFVNVPIKWIGVGPDREAMIQK